MSELGPNFFTMEGYLYNFLKWILTEETIVLETVEVKGQKNTAGAI